MGLTTTPGAGGGVQAFRLQAAADPARGRSQQAQTGLQVYLGGGGCPGSPHQLLRGSELTQWDLPLCQAHDQEGGAKRCWTASCLGSESLAREQAAYNILFCYKQPTPRSPLYPSTVVSPNPCSTG